MTESDFYGRIHQIRIPQSSVSGKQEIDEMSSIDSCTGKDLLSMLSVAVQLLERRAAELNSLNVFPVPDGDTGTNMLLTVRSALAQALECPDGNASEVAHAIAHGALMGARGNSGVILSQILRGVASKLDGKECLEGDDLVAGLKEGSNMAYKAVSQPVEGTILTVIRESSEAAQKAGPSNGLSAIVEAVVSAARDSVARTPSLLPVLRQAGVVDAGGLGLYVIFEGLLRYLRGEVDADYEASSPAAAAPVGPASQGPTYGYCTEFMIEGGNLNIDKIRARLEAVGESVVVVGDGKLVRVHVHTMDPGAAISTATPFGTLRQIKVENMDEQHEDFVQTKRSLEMSIAVVAVVSGEGLGAVFHSLGATAVVPGGATMNPSIAEILKVVETVPCDRVIVLPNDRNVVLAAEQARPLTAKRLEIVPTQSVPQGVSALLAFNYEADVETNVRAMEQARLAVRTIEITKAVRPATIGGFRMAAGQAIGFLDGELVAVGDIVHQLVEQILDRVDLSESEIVTIYYGADAVETEAEEVAENLRHKHSHLEVEVISGGEPHYHYIVSVE